DAIGAAAVVKRVGAARGLDVAQRLPLLRCKRAELEDRAENEWRSRQWRRWRSSGPWCIPGACSTPRLKARLDALWRQVCIAALWLSPSVYPGPASISSWTPWRSDRAG